MQSIQDTTHSPITLQNEFNVAASDLGRLWLDQMKDTVGFRRGSSPSPIGEMVAVEVCSWLQVPALIQELRQNKNCIRLTFPKCSDSTLAEEQSEVHSFLSMHHGLSLEEVRSHLVRKIEKSVFFQNSEIPRKKEVFLTGEDWVKAFIPNAMPNGGALAVTDVVVVDPQNVISTFSRINDQVISAPDTVTNVRQRILWLPSDEEQRSKIVEEGAFISALHSLHSNSSNTKVWIGDSRVIFDNLQRDCGEGASVAQLRWDEYQSKYLPSVKMSQQHAAEFLPGVTQEAITSITKYSENIESLVSYLAKVVSIPEFDCGNLKKPVNIFVRGVREGGVPFLRLPGQQSSLHPGACKGANAQEILDYCRTRSVSENAEKLLQAFSKNNDHFLSKSPIAQIKHRSDLVTLPAKGKAYFLTDLEGDVESVKRLIEKENILERWRANDPEDQVYLCVLGDSVDRSDTAHILINYLLELKYRENFEDKVWILSGNHEEEFTLQFKERLGFGFEVLARRKNEFPVERSEWDVWLQTIASLCPPSFKHPHFVKHCGGEDNLAIKGGMWALYYELFHRLPKMIRAENGAFAVHAGPPFAKADRLTQVIKGENLDKESDRIEFMAARAKGDEQHRDNTDMIWNDFYPEWSDNSNPNAILSETNKNRGTGRIYTAKAFERFAKAFDVSMMIRGHQSEVPEGAEQVDSTKGSWCHGSVLTLAGEYAQLDLSIVAPKVSDVIVAPL